MTTAMTPIPAASVSGPRADPVSVLYATGADQGLNSRPFIRVMDASVLSRLQGHLGPRLPLVDQWVLWNCLTPEDRSRLRADQRRRLRDGQPVPDGQVVPSGVVLASPQDAAIIYWLLRECGFGEFPSVVDLGALHRDARVRRIFGRVASEPNAAAESIPLDCSAAAELLAGVRRYGGLSGNRIVEAHLPYEDGSAGYEDGYALAWRYAMATVNGQEGCFHVRLLRTEGSQILGCLRYYSPDGLPCEFFRASLESLAISYPDGGRVAIDYTVAADAFDRRVSLPDFANLPAPEHLFLAASGPNRNGDAFGHLPDNAISIGQPVSYQRDSQPLVRPSDGEMFVPYRVPQPVVSPAAPAGQAPRPDASVRRPSPDYSYIGEMVRQVHGEMSRRTQFGPDGPVGPQGPPGPPVEAAGEPQLILNTPEYYLAITDSGGNILFAVTKGGWVEGGAEGLALLVEKLSGRPPVRPKAEPVEVNDRPMLLGDETGV